MHRLRHGQVRAHLRQVLLCSQEYTLGIIVHLSKAKRFADGCNGGNRNGAKHRNDSDNHQNLHQRIAKRAFL